MSRKKYQQSNNTFGARLRSYRKLKGLTSLEFCELIHISQGSLSAVENNKNATSSKTIDHLINNTDINIYWLFTGRGDPCRANENECCYAGGVHEQAVGWPAPDEDPEISELLNLTRHVLKSKTNYAESLSANIRSFHDAVQSKQETESIKQQLDDLRRRVDKINGGENNICPTAAGAATRKKGA